MGRALSDRPGLGAMRVVALVIGVAMLLFGVGHQLEPRARYVSATPEPGATLAAPPPTVTVRFSEALDPASTLSVTYQDENVTTASGLDPDDPRRRSLTASLRPGLPEGVYWVSWRTVAERGRVVRNGDFRIGAGVPVPARAGPPMFFEERGPGDVREREYRRRQNRSVLLGGVILILLGTFAGRLPQRR